MSPTHGTILIVDDSQDDIDLLLRTFKQVGVGNRIDVCRSAAEAEHYLQTHELPSVMLLDLKMPVKDGFYVLRKVKTSPVLRDLVVIVLTTSSYVMDIQLSYELGANSFLTKPLDLSEFREMVNAFHQYWIIHAKPSPLAGRIIPNPGEAA
jgi:two-component system, response regulator